jgi:hypothetical protein
MNTKNATTLLRGKIEKVVLDIQPMSPADAAEDVDARKKAKGKKGMSD